MTNMVAANGKQRSGVWSQAALPTPRKSSPAALTDSQPRSQKAPSPNARLIAELNERITMDPVEVTPALAKEWLERNVGNRKIVESNVQSLRMDLLNGKWVTNHQAIAFNDQGMLIDGQHRLLAIVAAGVSAVMMVSQGWQHDIAAPIDVGVNRKAWWVSAKNGVISEADGRLIQTIVNGLGFLEAREIRRVTPGLIEKAAKVDHADGIAWLVSRSWPTSIPRMVIAAFVYAYPTNPEATDEFATAIASGANLAKGSPALALREFIRTMKQYRQTWQRVETMEKALRALQLHIEGRKIEKLAPTPQGYEYFQRLRVGMGLSK